MIDVNRILFPTDFSETASYAKTYACDLANRFDAQLHALHIIHNAALEVPDFGMGLAFPAYVENLPKQRKEMEQAALKSLCKEMANVAKLEQEVVYDVQFGQPFLSIIDYATEHEIDMIVLGTHGRTGVSHVLLGSVAERVIRRASCPVLTVRLPGNEFNSSS